MNAVPEDRGAGTVPESPGERQPFDGFWSVAVACTMLLSAFVGFRLPNLWSTTLYAVSATDGVARRVVVGTILTPVFGVFGLSYMVAASFAFGVLLLLLVRLAYAGARSTLISQRFVVLTWLVSPFGAYMFHEVGYLDQVIYLLLFAALWTIHRGRWRLATATMVVAVLTHEIALVTVLPVVAFFALRRLDRRQALLTLGIPLLVGVGVLSCPPVNPTTIDRIGNRFLTEGYPFRPDALALFGRTQPESLAMYSVYTTLAFLLPPAIFIVSAWLLLQLTVRTNIEVRWNRSRWVETVAVIGASVAPICLAFGGWDASRWAFLMTANFAIVLYLWLEDRRVEFTITQCAVVAITFIALAHIPLDYFDGFEPRQLRPVVVRDLVRKVMTNDLRFRIPTM